MADEKLEVMEKFVKTEIVDNIAVFTIDRPKALNALNLKVMTELGDAFRGVDRDVIRCIIITGGGKKSFVAGADIGYMSKMTKDEARRWGKYGNDLFLAIEEFPIPVIAAVNGYALGGGCELCMACDIRICSENAVFGQPEVGLGITPGFGGTQRLARHLGAGIANELTFTARKIDAAEALRIGLVNHVYPQDQLMEEAMKMAKVIAKNAPIAVRGCKKAVHEGLQVNIDKAVKIEEEIFGNCFETHDQKEAMAAFMEKRKAEPFKNC